jgi:hypothetical protein
LSPRLLLKCFNVYIKDCPAMFYQHWVSNQMQLHILIMIERHIDRHDNSSQLIHTNKEESKGYK